MVRGTYKELLKDRRWQKRRLEVLAAAGWKCQKCGSTDDKKPLDVHHTFYIPGHAPWKYENDDLRVLCEDCHKLEHRLPPSPAQTAREERSRAIRSTEAQIVARVEELQQQRAGALPRTPIEEEIESAQAQIPMAEKSGDKTRLRELMARAIELNRRRLGMVD